MYLGKGQKRTLTAGLLGVAALLFVHGGSKVFSNPQTFSAAEVQRIHDLGMRRQSIALTGKKEAAVAGVLEMALAMGCLMLAVPLSEATPRRILPKSLDPADTPKSHIPAPPDALILLRSRLAELLSDYPWLKQCIACESLILIAPAGGGKSSIASVIAFLRAILRGHRVIILDPHGSINIERGVWLVGDVVQSEVDILGTQATITARHSKQEAHSAILDEFGALCADKNSATARFAAEIVGNAIRNNRKFHNHYIFLCHGRAKGQMGGEAMPSGYLDSWTYKSAVLELETDYDEWGEAVFSGRARFKPGGNSFDDDAAYTPLQIPDFLNPIAIRNEFTHLFAHLGLKQAEQRAQQPQYDPKIEQLIDEALAEENLPQIKTLLDRIYESSKEVNQCTSIDPIEIVAQLSDAAKQLLVYYFDKGQKYANSEGWLEVKVLRENWAKNKGILADQLKVILMETVTAEIAILERTCWKPRITKSDLPPSLGQV
ncbi:hypothetical protein [Leptolyngbya sp. FACHB-711]|uniref:hypothetical protein n=1 Tax=Leptolyngbya sp. FACHB-711 TaxID=2692813 RepID=UPI00168424F5|nr:hypothetical protein [Leptolyngbya sp. FACHB-711]MBD2023809.1 hypothetical protein [Leptolyngbya sp. FACHB-711]